MRQPDLELATPREKYADQNERDYAALEEAASGRIDEEERSDG